MMEVKLCLFVNSILSCGILTEALQLQRCVCIEYDVHATVPNQRRGCVKEKQDGGICNEILKLYFPKMIGLMVTPPSSNNGKG